MLTAKQEKFVQNMIKGMTQREAYRDAYKNNMTDKQVDEEACKLLNSNPKVNQRYKELIQKAEDKAIMSAIERKKWLTKVINGEIKDKQVVFHDGDVTTEDIETNIATKIKAMDTLNKMSGEYITRVEAEVESEVNINIELSDD